MKKFLPAKLFCEVFGKYVPRLCVDTVVIGPKDRIIFDRMNGFVPFFGFEWGVYGVLLKERQEEPRRGQWGLPGGTVFKGETLATAAKRIVRNDLGVEIEILAEIGAMEFPDERRMMKVGNREQEVTIDSKSFVLLAQATSTNLKPEVEGKAGWFLARPPPSIQHEYHTPFLIERGLLL